jgi:hypothetical protein
MISKMGTHMPRSILSSCHFLGLLVSSCVLLAPAARLATGADYIFTTYNVPDALDTSINDINDLGVFVGDFGDIATNRAMNPGQRGFMQTPVSLEFIEYPGSRQTSAQGLNNSGVVVGEYVDSSGRGHGFILQDGNYSRVDYPGANHTTLTDINDEGMMAGAYVDGLGIIQGFMYNGSQFSSYKLDTLSVATFLNGISNDGLLVGTSTVLDINSFPIAQKVVGFATPPDEVISVPNLEQGAFGTGGTFVQGISNANVMVGRYISVVGGVPNQVADVHYRGFIYEQGADPAYRDVDLPGSDCTFQLVQANPQVPGACVRSLESMNVEGTIVGYFDNNDGTLHGFVGRLAAVGDLNRDGFVNDTDIDLLAESIRNGNEDTVYDVNQSGSVTLEDLDYYVRTILSTRFGDANLDGVVDVYDFHAWNAHKNDSATGWANGDFNGDGNTSAGDFAIWQQNVFTSANTALVVPEPTAAMLVVMTPLVWHLMRRRRRAD